ncbi:MAG TPA: hypothetical protein PKX48_14405 [Planctomycetota bacterium]|jgi:hypothetical protein|nr:hypothetical protein [Planctomycetota bacterium]OQC19452.1 MAG: hypothetical protein BWX69_02733 [Planctomycetes bacterium ADurb.Bin069]NMD34793.1 hypothetical protein [Planctomycetota bacterium]HOE31257.1 hypothetical protein [Planctomycetota bacterium]HOE88193.1 hypothetical protein [Planctomycetota bacterium]
MKSARISGGEDDDNFRTPGKLTSEHIALLDTDRLYFDLERFKAERGWHNLNITRSGIAALLVDATWYRLLIPESELTFDSYKKVVSFRQACVGRRILRNLGQR